MEYILVHVLIISNGLFVDTFVINLCASHSVPKVEAELLIIENISALFLIASAF